MAFQFSDTVRNGVLDQIEALIGTAPLLKFYTGSVPATPATAASGTLLTTLTLPSDWLAAASGDSKSLLGTWENTSAAAAGTAGYFRILDSTGTTCHIQGTVTITGSGGDMTLDNTSIAVGQDVKVTSFTLAD